MINYDLLYLGLILMVIGIVLIIFGTWGKRKLKKITKECDEK